MKHTYWVSITGKEGRAVCVLFQAVSSEAAKAALEVQGYTVNFVHLN